MDESRRKTKVTPPTPKHLLDMSDKNETKHSIAQTDLSLLCMKNILVENTSVKIKRGEWRLLQTEKRAQKTTLMSGKHMEN